MSERCSGGCAYCHGSGGFEDYDGTWTPCSACDGNPCTEECFDMSNYMLTTSDVQRAYVAFWDEFGVKNIERAELRAEFDRWYAEEVRKAKEQAWDEAARHLEAEGLADGGYADFLNDDNPYRKEADDD